MKLPQALSLATTATESSETVGHPSAANQGIVSGLFKSQARKVRNFLTFRLKSGDDADDATQEVFLKLWRYEQSGKLRDEATAYMFSAAYSLATDLERQRSCHECEPLDDLDDETIPAQRPALEDERHWRDALARLVSELKQLPETRRKVFVLRYFKGLRYGQISKKLGISIRTVERQLAEAHRHLESRMKDYL